MIDRTTREGPGAEESSSLLPPPFRDQSFGTISAVFLTDTDRQLFFVVNCSPFCEHSRCRLGEVLFKAAISTIFVVDDDITIAETLAVILGNQGYSVLSFTSPSEALLYSKVRTPDLLLSDVVMPGCSGIDLAIQIRVLCPDCKVLLFSGLAVTSALQHSQRVLENGFHILAKPVQPKDLLWEISGLLQAERLSA